MVGGTAIALHLGHRCSIDFDLFSQKVFTNSALKRKITPPFSITDVLVSQKGEYTISFNNSKVTFLHYPFPIEYSHNFQNIIHIPDLLTLTAMKSYAWGRRAKWKDYVDLYFVLKHFHGIGKIITKAKDMFKNEFNEKLF